MNLNVSLHFLLRIVISLMCSITGTVIGIGIYDMVTELVHSIRKRLGIRKASHLMFNSIIRNLATFSPKLARYMKDPTYEDFKNLTLYHAYETILPLLNLSEANQIDIIRRHYHPEIIAHMKNPCESAKRLTINRRPYAIKVIKDPSVWLQRYAINIDPNAIYFIKNPSVSAMKLAVTKDPEIVNRLKDPPESVKKVAMYAILSKES